MDTTRLFVESNRPAHFPSVYSKLPASHSALCSNAQLHSHFRTTTTHEIPKLRPWFAPTSDIPRDFSHLAPQEQRILELKIEFAANSKNPRRVMKRKQRAT